MKITEMQEWLKTEFFPLELATPDDTLDQIVKNAIRYFNNNSAVKVLEMIAVTGNRTKVSKYIKAVGQVYPSSQNQSFNVQDFPVWTLLGVPVLGGLTTDLIMLNESYKNLQVYTGKDFQWTFVPSENPNDTNGGGYLYYNNVPSGATSLCVLGARRIIDTEDVTESFCLDWILRYSKALLKQIEGNTLRKSSIVGVNNDGQSMLDEGKEEQKDLQQDLSDNGRWLAMGVRG